MTIHIPHSRWDSDKALNVSKPILSEGTANLVMFYKDIASDFNEDSFIRKEDEDFAQENLFYLQYQKPFTSQSIL